MNRETPLLPEVRERTPPEAQAYIRALEARVVALEATVQQLRKRLQQDSHTSSRPPSSEPLRALGKRPLRDIEAMIERGGQSQALGEVLRTQTRQMFHWWYRVRDGTLSHASFASSMRAIRRAVERLLEAGQTCGVPKTDGVCREILKRCQALWTFVRHEGAEPTNNAAERAIRPGVLWREGRFGPHSAQRSCVVETMMTVVATLKQQHRNILAYVTAACDTALHHETTSSLIPIHDTLQHLRRAAA